MSLNESGLWNSVYFACAEFWVSPLGRAIRLPGYIGIVVCPKETL